VSYCLPAACPGASYSRGSRAPLWPRGVGELAVGSAVLAGELIVGVGPQVAPHVRGPAWAIAAALTVSLVALGLRRRVRAAQRPAATPGRLRVRGAQILAGVRGGCLTTRSLRQVTSWQLCVAAYGSPRSPASWRRFISR